MKKKRRENITLYWFWKTKGDKGGDYSINNYRAGETDQESKRKSEWEVWELNCEVGETTEEDCVQWEETQVISSGRET